MKSSDNDLPLFAAATHPRLWAVAGTPQPQEETPPTAAPSSSQTAGLALFQAGSADDNGYARWKAEAQAERAAQDERKRASELPTAADHHGYETWKAEIAKVRLAFEQRWGIPLGKVVRVRLRGEWQERQGLLRLANEAAPDRGRAVELRVGDHTFVASQIESVVRVD